MEVEESAKTPKPESREPQRHSTLVRKRIKRYEDLTTAKEERVRSPKLKSVRKAKDVERNQSKVQTCIKRFLEPTRKPSGALGARVRPGPAKPSRLGPGTPSQEGGKGGGVKVEGRTGSHRPLERWVTVTAEDSLGLQEREEDKK